MTSCFHDFLIKLMVITERLFQLSHHQTSLKTECLAGLSTFLAISYIIFVNPTILSAAGMNHGAVFVATCLVAALGSLMMGLFANYPIVLAPGMALNTYFTYSVVLGSHHSWQVALGAVFISGLIFFALSVLPIREYLINSIPKSLKLAIVAGIGLFLGVIGFKNAGIISGIPQSVMIWGHLQSPTVLLAILGFFIIIALDALHIIGSIIISILFISFLGWLWGYCQFEGFFSLPPSIMPTLLQMDIKGACSLGLMTIVFAFLFVDLFDNTGTLIAIAHRAQLMDEKGQMPRIGRVLVTDSTAAFVGAALGTSTTTSCLESAVGVKAGGRTGLTAIMAALCFLAALFMAPLAKSIPMFATAPAIIYISCLMLRAFSEIDWHDITEFAPALVMALAMPITFSIAEGITFGFISYTAIKLLSGRWRDLNVAVVVLSILFVVKYAVFTP